MNMPALRRTAAGIAVALPLLLSAQAGPEKGHPSWLPSADRALFIATAGDETTLSWKSELGKVYTILYTDKAEGNAIWQPLPGYQKMKGTGRTETIKFQTDPAAPRRYNLHIEPPGGDKPADSRRTPAPAPR